MSSCPSKCKESIRSEALRLGASACGFAAAGGVDDAAIALYDRWIAEGRNGEMEYCAKYKEQRDDPRLLLDADYMPRTVIVCAYNYYTGDCDLPLSHAISRYAWGDDYHWVVKSRLKQLADFITERYGGVCRAMVDTAPMRERYWAQRAGIGYIGVNNQLIVSGTGSYCFLGELLWTGEVDPDSPCTSTCDGCMRCVKACPGSALDGNGGCDARKCMSYLTIEYRGELSAETDLCGWIYGCDACQRVCPHNASHPVSAIAEFSPDSELLSLSADEVMGMTPSHYKRLVAHSAMRRVPLKQLQRNIRHNNHD